MIKVTRYFVSRLLILLIRKFTRYDFYEDQMLSTIPYFNNDDKFVSAKKEADKVWSHLKSIPDISWRLHTLLWSATSSIKSESENVFVECGTGKGYMFKGLYSYLNISYPKLDFKFFLVDSFLPNLPPKIENKLEKKIRENYWSYASNLEEVKNTFYNDFRVNFTIGEIPQILKETSFPKIDFLHIDLNNAYSEIETLKFFLPLMNKKSFILFDDYGFHDKTAQGKALTEFAQSNDLNFLSLGTGQGLIYIN